MELIANVRYRSRLGKTEIALTAISKVLRSSPHARVFYISPTKALVNQIYLEVMTRFGGNDWRPSRSIAGILTADFQIATQARVRRELIGMREEWIF